MGAKPRLRMVITPSGLFWECRSVAAAPPGRLGRVILSYGRTLKGAYAAWQREAG